VSYSSVHEGENKEDRILSKRGNYCLKE